VVKGGLTLLIKSLKVYSDDFHFVQQALSLLICIISEDAKAKINLSAIRHTLLFDGTIDLINKISKKFPEQSNIIELSKSIISTLVADYS